MARTLHTLILILLLAGNPSSPIVESDTVAPPSVVVVDGGNAIDRNTALVDWALGRYEEAGLVLPDIRVSFHSPDSPECPGYGVGRWRLEETGHRVWLCTASKRVLLHELAHAWAHENLDASQRGDFVDHLSLESWDSAHIDHGLRGMEQAAEIIAWGLLDRRDQMPHLGGIDKASAYQLLTGSTSPFRTADQREAHVTTTTTAPVPTEPVAPAPMIPIAPKT